MAQQETDPTIDYPKLSNFIGAYFHQDWYEDQKLRNEPADVDLVVGHIIDKNSREYLVEVSRELALVITRYDDVGLTRLIVKKFYGNVRPELRNQTMRSWLSSVKDRIDEHLRFSL